MQGVVYVEARLKHEPSHDKIDTRGLVKGEVSRGAVTEAIQKLFDDGKITAVKLNLEMCGLDDYGSFPRQVESVKVVEYVGNESTAGYFSVAGCKVTISTYRYLDHIDVGAADVFKEGCLLAYSLLPSIHYEGRWESIICDTHVKEDLIKCLTNLLRFSTKGGTKKSPSVNRLLLLAGPPGTGKSTLAVSLAQKLSIRLHYSFTSGTVLYQLDAATLLSQFFGQSAVKIHNVFEALLSASEISPPALCILVIDEVESLAACRSRANAQGEVQDAVRATNALLTGLDKVMCRPNVLVICTSNLESSIDQAFLDRCSKRIEVGFPSAAGRYKILKHGLESLIERGIVVGDNLDLPDFDAAECRLPDDFNTVGCKLRRLAESFAESFIESKSDYLDSFAAPTEFKSEWLKGTQLLSPRWLSQLPELALAQQLEIGADTCTLEHCVAHIEAYFKAICPRSCPKRAPAPVCDAARSEKLRSLDISSVITEEEKRWRSCEEGAERKWKVIKKITSSPSKPSLTFSLDQRTLKLIVNAVVQEIDKRKTENMPDPVERLECSTTTMVTTDSGGSEWRPGSKRSLDDGDAPSHCNSPCSPGCSPSKRRRRLADSNLVPVDVAITKQAKVVKEAEEAIL